MKRLGVLLLACVLGAMFCSTAVADPKESFRKLAGSFAGISLDKENNLPVCPLSAEEAEEIVGWIQKGYKKQGVELSDLQAALMVGMMASYAAVGDKAQAASKDSASGSTPQAQGAGAPPAKPAGPLPEYDSAAYCKHMAEMGSGGYTVEAGCRDMEKDAKAQLLGMDIPADILKTCKRMADMGGKSYTVLQGCVDMELDSMRQLQGK